MHDCKFLSRVQFAIYRKASSTHRSISKINWSNHVSAGIMYADCGYGLFVRTHARLFRLPAMHRNPGIDVVSQHASAQQTVLEHEDL